MGAVFFIVVIVLPILLIHYHSKINEYDEFGVLTEDHNVFHASFNQHFSFNDCTMAFACCSEFK
jgi:hypothetical protein